jgi:hypothetical protein
MKASLLEESEAELEDQPLPGESPHHVDVDVADAAQGIPNLGKYLFVLWFMLSFVPSLFC